MDPSRPPPQRPSHPQASTPSPQKHPPSETPALRIFPFTDPHPQRSAPPTDPGPQRCPAGGAPLPPRARAPGSPWPQPRPRSRAQPPSLWQRRGTGVGGVYRGPAHFFLFCGVGGVTWTTPVGGVRRATPRPFTPRAHAPINGVGAVTTTFICM